MEKNDLTEKLEQLKGQVHSLQGEVKMHDGELAEFRDEVHRAQEAKSRDNFNLF